MGLQRVGVSLLIVATGLVAGCGLPSDPAPSGFVPQSGVCHLKIGDNVSGATYAPVRCSERHEAETFMVGRFDFADAEADEPPTAGSDGALRAYSSCSIRAHEFVGDDWATGRLTVRVALPTSDGWAAAERWFRCDLVEIVALDLYEPSPRANSLKDALRSSASLRHGCYNPTFNGTQIETLPPASCTGPHQSEFTGVWWPDDVRYGEEIPQDDVVQGCYGVGARYVGGVDEQELARRMTVFFWMPADDDRIAGASHLLCFLHTDGRPLKRSLAGVGLPGLPVAR